MVDGVARKLHQLYARDCGDTNPERIQKSWDHYAEFMRESWRERAREVIRAYDVANGRVRAPRVPQPAVQPS